MRKTELSLSIDLIYFRAICKTPAKPTFASGSLVNSIGDLFFPLFFELLSVFGVGDADQGVSPFF